MSFLFVKQSSATCKILLSVFVIILSICSTEASENGTYAALIAFGDSILDTGNNNNLNTGAKCDFPPYGTDFIGGRPTGRFCDGKILTDLIAEGLGIKDTVPAYLDPYLRSSDLPTGVCFASGGSGLDPLTANLQSVLSISDQLNYFKEYLRELKGVVGEEKANNIISNSLFLLSSGNNDLAISYFLTGLRALQYDVPSYTSILVNSTSSFLKELYRLGVRKFAVLSTLPLGCLPVTRTLMGGLLRECSKELNRAAPLFNSKLSAELKNLHSSLPQAKIVYVDIYNPLLALINNPAGSGFIDGDTGCCGTGILEAGPLCNMLNPFTCPDPYQFVFWDSAHPSEQAYRILASPVLHKLKNNVF